MFWAAHALHWIDLYDPISVLHRKKTSCPIFHSTVIPSNALYVPLLLSDAMHFTVLSCTARMCTALYCPYMHWTALLCTEVQCTEVHCTEMHCTSLLWLSRWPVYCSLTSSPYTLWWCFISVMSFLNNPKETQSQTCHCESRERIWLQWGACITEPQLCLLGGFRWAGTNYEPPNTQCSRAKSVQLIS